MKNQSIIFMSVIAVGVGLALGYALWGATDGSYRSEMQSRDNAVPTGMHRMPDGSLMGNGTTENQMGMMGSMDHSNMMVRSEREFLEGMIPHHQEAVDTAKEVIARGGSTPGIKQLAEEIVVAQEKEITMMKSWYQDWYGTAYVENPDAYEPMMRDLSKLSGAALDKVFLEDMIMHHMGAIMMARSVQPYLEHEEMRTLTSDIVRTQSEEIQTMESFLRNL